MGLARPALGSEASSLQVDIYKAIEHLRRKYALLCSFGSTEVQELMGKRSMIAAAVFFGTLALGVASCNINAGNAVGGRSDSSVPRSDQNAPLHPTQEQLVRMIRENPGRVAEIINRYVTPSPDETAICIPGKPRNVIVEGETIALPPDADSNPIDCNFSSPSVTTAPQFPEVAPAPLSTATRVRLHKRISG